MESEFEQLQRGVLPAEAWYGRWADRAVLLGGTPAGRLASSHGFVARRTELLAVGLDDNDLRRLVRRREWSRPDRGVFSPVVIEGDGYLERRERHALASTAAAQLRGGHAITAGSASVLHALPVLSLPELPILTTLGTDNEGRRDGVHVRSAALQSRSLTTWFGAIVSDVARTVVDSARLSRHDGIMAADAALHQSLTTRAALRRELERQAGWPGIRQARFVVEFADGDAESPLESLVRLALYEDGFPAPKLQQVIAGYQVDFYWPEYRLVLEADGRVKYRGAEGWEEKKRQVAVARADCVVERVIWSDLFSGWPKFSAYLRPYFRFPLGSVRFRPAN
jgi:hypothetical protein